MTMAPGDAICVRISKLDANVSYDAVQQVLEPILDPQNTASTLTTSQKEESRSDCITPLLLACDKGQVETCRWLLDQVQKQPSLEAVVGSVVQDRAPESGNTCIHQAARLDILQLLVQSCHPGSESLVDVTRLATLTNHHHDTPLMMAVVDNSSELVSYWCHSVSDADLATVLSQRNQSGDSAISLACGHGHVEILQILLEAGGGTSAVVSQDLELALESLARTQKVQHQAATASRLPQNERQRMRSEIATKCQAMQTCVELLQQALEQQSQAAALELLEEETGKAPESKTSNETKKKAKAKRKKKNSNKVTGPSNDSSTEEPLQETSAGSDPGGVTASAPGMTLVPLSNGKKAVAVSGRSLDTDSRPDSTMALPDDATATAAKSVDDLFCSSAAAVQKNSSGAADLSDLLEALCLNVSQLLLPAHGMALNLSPSQLDAVDQILERQRAAVQEAREIQQRLHATAVQPPPPPEPT